jgi:PucR family transcriptional regulator, purine catabolism regulatory protein
MATASAPSPQVGPVGPGEAALLRKLVAMCSHLSALASQATELSAIARVLADGIGSGVVVVDRRLEILADTRSADHDEITSQLRDDARPSTLRTVLTAAARNRRALTVPGSKHGRMIVIAPVFAGEDVAGYLLTVNNPDQGLPEDMRLLATEHAAMVCGIVLGRDLVVTAAAGRARQELIEGLLLSRDHADPEVERWARHLGLDPTREHYVMAFDVPQNRASAGSLPIELLLTRNVPGAILASRDDEVVAIVPLSGDAARSVEPRSVEPRSVEPRSVEQGRALARACLASDGQHPKVTGIGIGNPCSSAADIARSYAEARRALAAGRRMGQTGTISAFADLGIHRLLLRVPEVSDLRSFAEEVLGGLAEETRSTGIDYLATLSVYFRENGSPRRAAQQLHVHPNTVSYRVRRVEELTGLSFGRHRDRLMAEVAVEILEGLEGRS